MPSHVINQLFKLEGGNMLRLKTIIFVCKNGQGYRNYHRDYKLKCVDGRKPNMRERMHKNFLNESSRSNFIIY